MYPLPTAPTWYYPTRFLYQVFFMLRSRWDEWFEEIADIERQPDNDFLIVGRLQKRKNPDQTEVPHC